MTPQAMARLHAAAFTQSRPWSAEEFAALLDSTGTFVTGDETAFALVRVIADEAELLTIATDPAHRRQGRARRLLETMHAETGARGGARVFLEVADDNLAARALYEASGYSLAGRRKGYYHRADGPAADALIMVHDLTA